MQHPRDMPRPRRTGGGQGAMRGAGAPAEHGGDAGMQGVIDLLRTDKVNMAVKPAGCEDLPLAGNHLGARSYDNIDIGLRIGISGLADRGNATIAQRDIGFVNARIIQNQRIGDHRISGAGGARGLRLPHAVTDHFAAAKFNLFAIARQVFFNFDENLRIGQTQLIARGWPIHPRIISAANIDCHVLQIPHDFSVKSKHPPVARYFDKADRAFLPGFKAHSGSCSDIQTLPMRRAAVKFKCGIGFGKMVMAAHLNGPVARICDQQFDRLTALIQDNIARGADQFARFHRSAFRVRFISTTLEKIRTIPAKTGAASSGNVPLCAPWGKICGCAKAGTALKVQSKRSVVFILISYRIGL